MHRNVNVERLKQPPTVTTLNSTSHSISCQVPLVPLALKVRMVDLVAQVSVELLVDQENLADQELQVHLEKRVRQVATESLDQLESKESQVCP